MLMGRSTVMGLPTGELDLHREGVVTRLQIRQT